MVVELEANRWRRLAPGAKEREHARQLAMERHRARVAARKEAAEQAKARAAANSAIFRRGGEAKTAPTQIRSPDHQIDDPIDFYLPEEATEEPQSAACGVAKGAPDTALVDDNAISRRGLSGGHPTGPYPTVTTATSERPGAREPASPAPRREGQSPEEKAAAPKPGAIRNTRPVDERSGRSEGEWPLWLSTLPEGPERAELARLWSKLQR
jgi:hypothetical protein